MAETEGGSIRFFAGGNTARGFYSCFESVFQGAERVWFLKGGPGVGKSTFMRRVGEAAERQGHFVEYFHCSSDPDSLDGVAIPALRAALMDGTAPHVYDPTLPGARDTLVSLGDFLDEDGLRPHGKELERLKEEISGCFRRCYRYLRAASEVRSAASAPWEEAEGRALAARWRDQMPLRGGLGGVRRLFAGAYTPKGFVSLLDALPVKERFSAECPFGCDLTPVLGKTAENAMERGLRVTALLDPLEPRRLAAVFLPDFGMLFGPGEGEATGLFDLPAGRERETGFDQNACELLCQRAVEQLSQAKRLHDELEKPYGEHMDFLRWQETLEKTLAALGLGGKG